MAQLLILKAVETTATPTWGLLVAQESFALFKSFDPSQLGGGGGRRHGVD